jgi:hypothetical protein
MGGTRRTWVTRLSQRAATLPASAFGLFVLATAGVVAQAALSPAALVGKWQGVERTGPIAIAGQVLFFQNGTYQRYHVAGALQAIDSGSFQVAQNWIHFYVTDYQPKSYGGKRLAPPPSDTWVVNGFNGNPLAATIGGATQIQYQRSN